MLTITLAYSTDDQTAAHRIAGEIASHVDLHHIPVGKANEGPLLADLLRDVDHPIVLLISHAFLTNPNCMLNGHELLRAGRDLLPVFVRGRRYDELSDEMVESDTALGTQADVMNYVNHWQDRYIDLRSQAEELAATGGEPFRNYLRKIRETSTQAEELLYTLKDTFSLTTDRLAAHHYQQLFLFADRPKLWEEFRDYTDQPVDVSGIPGLEMLGNAVTMDDDTVVPPYNDDEVASSGSEAAGPPLSGSEQGRLAQAQGAGPQGAGPQVRGELEEPGPPKPEPEPDSIVDSLDAAVVDLAGNEAQVVPIAGDRKEHPVVVPSENLTDDEQAVSWITRAWALFDGGEGEAGLELLGAGREALPDHPDLAYHHALLSVSVTGNIAEARQQLDRLLQTQPEHTDALFLAGELAETERDFHKAREYWEELSDAEPFYPDLNYRLGCLLDDHFPAQYLEVAAYLRRATKNEEATGDAFHRYGRLMAGALERPKKALRLLRRATELDPGNAAAHFDLARVLRRRNDPEAAANAFLTASHLDANLATAANQARFLPRAGAPENDGANAAADHELLLALQAKVDALEQQLTQPDPAPAAPPEPKLPRPGAGKTVFISGATSGIGRATAYRLAADGYRLILLGRRADRLDAIGRQLEAEHGVEVFTLRADVRHRTALRTAVNNLPDDWRTIDVLLNNAGKAKGFDPIHTGDYAHWDEMIDVNLKGLLTLTREISPLMVARGEGTIVNVCSTAGKEVYPNGNVYCATKHAVDALTYAIRLDLVQHGIRVGQICPAHVEATEFAVVRFDGDTERAKIYTDFQPLRSRDVADAVHFMISQPRHVNIMDVVLQGTQQASSTVVDRSGRDKFAPEEE